MARVAGRILVFFSILIIALSSSLESWKAHGHPTSGRKPSLLYASSELEAGDDFSQSKDDANEEMKFISRRIGFQYNDYPGTGANNHHMPKQPPGGDY
ncbi:OLC1v1032764C1 [Oldenlandia corymbosa var. corymbosa]|uniref:OLC1v1032764C1 n=1 Tax=Oldenlandia corymbosa var. corymbosa TaxID=529605 RepID=A0AAV1CPY3_OLDCO|nr:OLC1v1032764C1 [Oldenlandia corymbosa var. corymbosa]